MTHKASILSIWSLVRTAPLRTSVRAALVACVVAGMASASAAASPENPLINGVNGPAKWLHNYGQGRQLARDLGLPLIVHFYAPWCVPCQEMERETLSSKQLLGQFGRQVIGVKIDSDEEPGLTEAFRVEGLPCDIVIAPDGLIVGRNSGKQERSEYLAMVTKLSGRFREERAAAIARLQQSAPSLPVTKPNLPAVPPRTDVQGSRNLASNSGASRPQGRPATPRQQPNTQTLTPRQATQPPSATPTPSLASNPPLVGLDGYCPVHIQSKREWIKGRGEYSTTWQGVVYQFPTEADLRTFQSAPQKYAPRMLGCDPVQLWLTERAVQGSVEFGAFFNGDLFLFVSAESRNQFKVNPSRYVQLRTAFHADDVIGTRLR